MKSEEKICWRTDRRRREWTGFGTLTPVLQFLQTAAAGDQVSTTVPAASWSTELRPLRAIHTPRKCTKFHGWTDCLQASYAVLGSRWFRELSGDLPTIVSPYCSSMPDKAMAAKRCFKNLSWIFANKIKSEFIFLTALLLQFCFVLVILKPVPTSHTHTIFLQGLSRSRRSFDVNCIIASVFCRLSFYSSGLSNSVSVYYILYGVYYQLCSDIFRYGLVIHNL